MMSLSSSIPKLILTLALFGAFFVSFSSQAASNVKNIAVSSSDLGHSKSDIKAGKQIFIQKGCVSCHGANGMGSEDPDEPNLVGQKDTYIINALGKYKSSVRTGTVMTAMAKTLNNEEIKKIAAYLHSISRMTSPIQIGKRIFIQKGCVACHGVDGRGSNIPNIPNLVGQKEVYIINIMNEYKSNARKNVVMRVMAATVNEEEIKNIAAYLYSLNNMAKSKK